MVLPVNKYSTNQISLKSDVIYNIWIDQQPTTVAGEYSYQIAVYGVTFLLSINLFSKMTNLFNPSLALTKASTFSVLPVITSKFMIRGQFYMIYDVLRTQLWL